MNKQDFTGPIPGENYTSDTRNYPWHRPPEHTSIDSAIVASLKQLTQREAAQKLLTTLQSGLTVAKAADMFVTSGIGAGKWTPDFAILLAGPVAKMIEIMATDAGIEFKLGLDDKHVPTIAYAKAKAEIGNGPVNAAIEGVKAADIKPPSPEVVPKGFMQRNK